MLDDIDNASELVLQSLRRYFTVVKREIERAGHDPIALAEVFIKTRLTIDKLKEANTQVNLLFEDLKTKGCPDLFELRGVRKQEIDHLDYTVSLSAKLITTIIKDKKKEALEFLRSQQAGSLIEENVQYQTLTKYAGEYFVAQGEYLPAELFKTYNQKTMRMTKIPRSKRYKTVKDELNETLDDEITF